MRGEVSGIMAPRVDVEFMRDVACGEHFVERRGAGIEAKVVFVSTIEIDFQAGEGCGAGHGNGAVLVPEGRIGRIAENASEHARARRIGRRTSEKNGQLVDQRSAVGADGRKKLRMAKRKMQRSIAAHGNAGDGPMGTAWR